jgi:hypothetical protein
MNGFSEVPEPESGILGRGDDQPRARVRRRVGQLVVVARQLMQQLGSIL